jgi:excisionase family DNA binding protein
MITAVTSPDKGETVSHHLTTIQEASAEFGVSIGMLYAWVVLGKIPYGTTSGGLVLIRRAAVQRAVAVHDREVREEQDGVVRIQEEVG